MGLLRSLVVVVLTIGLIPTVIATHILRLSNQTLFETNVGTEILMSMGFTQSQIGMVTMGLMVTAIILVGLIFQVTKSPGTTFQALGVSLTSAGGPVFAIAYVLENRPEPIVNSLSPDMQTFVYNLSEFSDPFIGGVSHQSLIILVTGVGLLFIARVIGASQS